MFIVCQIMLSILFIPGWRFKKQEMGVETMERNSGLQARSPRTPHPSILVNPSKYVDFSGTPCL